MLEIVCGKPGSGKTSYVVAHVINEEFKFNNSRYFNSKEYIKFMNDKYQINLSLPPQRHVVSANFDIYRKFPTMRNYKISGFKFGVPNEFCKTEKLIPFGLYIFDESQKYFDSKNNKELPPWVTQAFELRRHISLDIYLISQRYIRIHKDIRDISDCFTYIEEITHIYELENGEKVKSHILLPYGELKQTVWDFRKFETEAEIEAYLSGNKSIGMKGCYKFNGDINKYYDTHSYATVVEDLKGDFSYYDYDDAFIDNRPEAWDNYKQKMKNKACSEVK